MLAAPAASDWLMTPPSLKHSRLVLSHSHAPHLSFRLKINFPPEAERQTPHCPASLAPSMSVQNDGGSGHVFLTKAALPVAAVPIVRS